MCWLPYSRPETNVRNVAGSTIPWCSRGQRSLAFPAVVLGLIACSAEPQPSGDGRAGSAGSGGAPVAGASGNPSAGDKAAGGAGDAGQGAGATDAGGRAGQSSTGGSGGSSGADVAGAAAGGTAAGASAGGAGGTASLDCRDGQYDGKTYRVCPQAGLDRAAARAFCQARGEDLLQLDAAAEESWAYEFVTESGSLWLGANDIDQEGDWRWPDGSSVAAGYTAWAEGQPNDSGDGEDCAVLHSGMGEWNDVACDATTFGTDALTIICEP